ncbi:hypothetical protein GSS88_09570 [Corynebacterium sp. 3HC-13]|uniref:hypothetical protein n=1 Tax=Corynebacterium poyangense TaxID=2684405 RepID=UPI001CCFCE6E|nr:hypothetical protein [Corynebacterium poyangense]MBZ8178032.1 hypothetical protein [Corynebacterium poyangense]
MASLAAPHRNSATLPPRAPEEPTTPLRTQIALSLLALMTGFCLVIASITPHISHHRALVWLLAAIVSTSSLVTVQGLWRRESSRISRMGSWLSSLGGLLVLGVGALHALNVLLAGGQFGITLFLASTYVIPGATIACLAGGILRLPAKWRLPVFAVTSFCLLTLCVVDLSGIS